jgi:hypothetical protein
VADLTIVNVIGGINKMASVKVLTEDEIARRIDAARQAEKRARAKIAKLNRVSKSSARRRETQLLCTLGRTIMSWSRDNEKVMTALRVYMSNYINRDTDFDILDGTAWAVERPAAGATQGAENVQ